jgi:LysR family glycine cleavage system transcriptional activator
VTIALPRIVGAVRQIRQSAGRRSVSLTTFASFASMWLIPRLEQFQRDNPDIDIRVSAADAIADLDDPELDLALRYCSPAQAPVGALRMFGEVLTPVVSRSLAEQIRVGRAPPLSEPASSPVRPRSAVQLGPPRLRTTSWSSAAAPPG